MLFPITSSQYAKGFKRIVQSPKFNHSEYLVVLSLLIAGKPLPTKYSNHPLSGPYKIFWDCHITNDCVLIYRIIDNELQAMKIDLFFLQQGMDTSTPSGRMIFSVFGAIGEFEKNLIGERVIAGQRREVANGVKMGRPSKMNKGMKSAAKLLIEKGMGIKQISKQLQIGVRTVYLAI